MEVKNINLSFIPKLTESLFYTCKGDKHLFLNTDLPNWQVVNQNSAFIIGQVDGNRTIQDILNILKEKGIIIDSALVIKLFEQFKLSGIINDDILIENKNDCCNSKSNKLHAVHFKLTDECNLACKYCYAESGSKKDILPLEKLKSVVDEISEISNYVNYTLSGGEPLLYPDIFELMEHIRNYDSAIALLTNGMYINNDNVDRIVELCSLIKISIDGSCEDINSITRGKNSFNSALKGYELLVERNANVMVSMTVTKKNIHDIENMANLFGGRLNLQPFFKAGRGSLSDELGITGNEYYEAMAKIENFQPMSRLGKTLEGRKNRGVTKCTVGDSEISISDNGNVYPCHMLTKDEFIAGNVKDNSIKNILKSKILKEVSSFSSLTNDECKECPIKLLCGGACRARSYHETGSVFINSDFCEYEKLAFINGIFEHSQLQAL